MTKLPLDRILQRAPNIKVLVNSSTDVKILINGTQIDCGSYTLSILEVFSYPVSVSNGLKALQARVKGPQDWLHLRNTIAQFYNAGILIEEAQVNSLMSTSPLGFDTASIHTRMLNDKARTTAFFDGIREVVRPGDIVVDIGTGTGILAIAAARAGAAHVYAIEASGIGKTAKAVFEANGLADRITLLSGWSTQIDLPERADVLIAEIIGNEPLGEEVLETTLDACRRLLKPDARLIPRKLRIFGLPITIPNTELTKRTFTTDTLKNWHQWYDIDFSPLPEMIRDLPQSFLLNPQVARNWITIADPVLLADVDFKTVQEATIDYAVTTSANVAGTLNGLLIYFELELGPNIILSTHPARTDKDNHWYTLVWVFSEPLILQAGDNFNVRYRYRVPGSRDHVQVTKV